MNEFILSFTPLFFAVNVFGILPMYISLTAKFDRAEARTLAKNSTLTALVVAIVFLYTGKFIFSLMGITADDFRIGGGIVLFLIAVMDLLFSNQGERRSPTKESGVVPIGIPLILGPASMATIMVLAGKFGNIITLVAILANLLIVYLVFYFSRYIRKVIGAGGAMAMGKVMALFLAAIGVMMVRVGISNYLAS